MKPPIQIRRAPFYLSAGTTHLLTTIIVGFQPIHSIAWLAAMLVCEIIFRLFERRSR